MNTSDPIKYVELPHPDKLLIVERLDYNNPYDHTRMHRHDYFEILLISEGHGSQRIDFSHYNIQSGDIFVVYPGQVHLMNRQSANGLLLQFRKDLFEHIHPVKHYHFYTANAINLDTETFTHLYELASRVFNLFGQRQLPQISIHKAYSYLQIILISLVEALTGHLNGQKEKHLLGQYLSLITAHVYSKKKVSEYCSMMQCNADKLNEICKTNLGKTALELIHEEQLLEIRRLLLLDELSLKEIAYQLNFDSQANFSAFIKNRTGMTPTQLQQSVLEIYK